MTNHKIGVLKGDGIGPEIVSSTVKVVEEAAAKHNLTIQLSDLPVGWEAIERYGHPLPAETKTALEDMDAWLLGPHDSASYPEEFKALRNPSGELRHYFDLFSNVRPAKNMPGIVSFADNADLVIYRENTEGFYADRNMFQGSGEVQITEGVAVTAGVFTREGITRIAHEAFKAAEIRGKKVTIVHKANVLRLSSGLFLSVCKDVAEEYPDIEMEEFHIDAMAAHLVRRIEDFDVIVAENMFGDILSDLTGELVGSLGVAPSINSNAEKAMAQAAHGSAPDIAGENTANPMGMILSAAMLFEWLYVKHDEKLLKYVQESIENAVNSALKDGILTKDLGGDANTDRFTDAVIERL